MERTLRILLVSTLMAFTTACSFNPFTTKNRLSGNPAGAVIGGGVGAGSMLAIGAPKSLAVLAGVGGAALGYYVTTLDFSAGGIKQVGGQVYTLGDFITIEIPTDSLFDVNSCDFLPNADPILRSAINILERKPDNNIMVSGSTSGFSTAKFEQKLSEDRARQIAGFLWANGVNDFQYQKITTRKLIYVGYGDYFPIANNIRAESIRSNSRIQITSYPGKAQLKLDKRHKIFNNIGAMNDSAPLTPQQPPVDYNRMFPGGKILPEGSTPRKDEVFPE